MAVCVKEKHSGKITRVSKAEAKKLVGSGGYEYTSKSEWQRQGGDSDGGEDTSSDQDR